MQSIKLNIPIVEIPIPGSNGILSLPMIDHQVVHLGVAPWSVARRFATRFQKSSIEKGEYVRLLDYTLPDDFELRETVIEVNPDSFKKKLDFRAFEIVIQYLLHQSERGYWMIIPTLGVETFTTEVEKIENKVHELVLLDFVRNRRFDYVQNVISTLWYQELQLNYHPAEFTTYTLSELDQINEQKKEEILKNAANLLHTFQSQLFGYEKVLKQLLDSIKNKYNRNVLLVGKSGVGKTALVKELVARHHSKIPAIWATTASTLIKELTGNLGWQENLSLLCKELMNKGEILYISNLLELFEVGQYQGNAVSMAEYLRDYMSRGEISLISECTDEEYALIEARSPNYMNNFQVIRVEEPQDKELEQIILNKVLLLADKKKLEITKEAIAETVRLNKRYTPYSGFPGKPIRFLESILVNTLADQARGKKKQSIDRSRVIQSFCAETGMPQFMVDPDIPMDVPALKEFFFENIFGQDHAVHRLSDVLVSVKAALIRPGKPIASMLFAGPTGVGKTEMAKILAEFMFGSRERMIRFDMSEYATPYAISRLTGEGYFSDGVLTSAIRREPFCVLLFDELEKAHPLFNDLLLQMLGEGRLTDSQGKVVNFCSTIIIMTSNIGASKLQTRSVGWNNELSAEEVASHFTAEVRKYFRPEIFNRIDQIVAFHPLSKEVMQKVVARELQLLQRREGIAHRKLDLRLSEALRDYLCDKGYDPKYGARALQRTLREELIIPLAFELNQYGQDDRLQILVDIENDELQIQVEADPLQFELLLEELAQNEYMDYASELRYEMASLREGQFYVHLLSDLDMLKRESKKKKDKFWQDEASARKYSNFLAMQQRVEDQTIIIEELEMEMALASMNLRSINTALYDQLKAWDEEFFKLKLDLYRLLDPDADRIFIGIYNGKHKARMQNILNLYLKAIEQKEFSVQVQSVWYREKTYTKKEQLKIQESELMAYDMSEVDIVRKIEHENKPNRVIIEVPKKEYIYKTYNPADPKGSLRKEEKDDLLVGFELQIKGPGANLYFGHETQLHAFEFEENKFKYFYLYTFNGPANTPVDIFKQDLLELQRRPRRKYGLRSIQDDQLDFPKHEIYPKDYLEEMLKIWDKLFKNHLNELVK